MAGPAEVVSGLKLELHKFIIVCLQSATGGEDLESSLTKIFRQLISPP